jgi:ATP-binding cassette, subfamily B, bacterial
MHEQGRKAENPRQYMAAAMGQAGDAGSSDVLVDSFVFACEEKNTRDEKSNMGVLLTIGRKLKRFLELGQVVKPMSLIAPYVLKYRITYLLLVMLLLAGIGVTLFLTWFMQSITDAAIAGDLGSIRQLTLIGLASIAFSGIIAYLNTYLEARAVVHIQTDLKNDLFAHMLKLPNRYFAANHSGELVSHLTNDVNSIHGVIGSNLISILRLPLIAIAAFVYLAQINWQLSLLCVLLGPVAALSGAIFGKLLRKNSRIIHEQLGKLHSFLNDSFAGNTVIRSFTLEKLVATQYENQNSQLRTLEMKLAKLKGFFQVGAGMTGSMSFVLCLGVGAYYVASGSLTIGALMAFVRLMQYLIYPLSGLASLWGGFQRSLAAVERIQGVFEQQPETRELPAPRAVARLKRSIELRGVSFSYDGVQPTLADVDFTVPAGKVVALVGASGAGKSTLFQLIMGFHTPQTGMICFDGQPVHAMSLAELRSCTAYVPQETYLFSGTVRDNIAYGRADASEEELIRAAKDANAHDWIVSLEKGYDTEIGERGVKLSGGQKQRIAIARAILKDAPILLLDEATSALDSETEAQVQEALERLMSNRTTIVIAHRLSTIHNADQIVVLDQGQVIEQGTHGELIDKQGVYARLYKLQYGRTAEVAAGAELETGGEAADEDEDRAGSSLVGGRLKVGI